MSLEQTVAAVEAVQERHAASGLTLAESAAVLAVYVHGRSARDVSRETGLRLAYVSALLASALHKISSI